MKLRMTCNYYSNILGLLLYKAQVYSSAPFAEESISDMNAKYPPSHHMAAMKEGASEKSHYGSSFNLNFLQPLNSIQTI
jgi:hypothetical protein